METLTVYETVLYSALLRLPRDMSEDEKIARVYGTLEELGIRGIMGRRIGGSGESLQSIYDSICLTSGLVRRCMHASSF